MKLASILKIFVLSQVVTPVLSASNDWSSVSGHITYKNETQFKIKGLSWFGLETCDFALHGLWSHPMTWYLDFIQANKFNLLRIPFSQQWVKNSFDNQQPNSGTVTGDPSLQGKTSLQMLDTLFDECSRRGIFILLDMHRLRCDAQSHEVWYSLDSSEYTADTFFQSWQKMLDRYSHHYAFHGIDLLNEPRGQAQWGSDPSSSWNLFVESAFATLRYDGLIYIEGVNWGHDLGGMRDHVIRADASRLVFSPHVYGPSVVGGSTDLDVGHLQAGWNDLFGYLTQEQKAVVVGEYGGVYTGQDQEWQNKFADYMIQQQIPGIYWCLNADSGDTGGLVTADWSTPQQDKLDLLARIEPEPTIIPSQLYRCSKNRKLRGLSPDCVAVM